MLAPDYLDHAPDRLVLLWQQVEDDILRDVARHISKMESLTPTATGSCGDTSRWKPCGRTW